MPLSIAQRTECFHLAFLQVLTASPGGRRHILKGGTNLRYFFDSVRYSEDIDFDTIFDPSEGWRLEEKVDSILTGRALPVLLRSHGLSIETFSKPKQTGTTRRWKVRLRGADTQTGFGTKVEFSNRNGETRHQLDAVPARAAEPYGVRPPTVRHYLAPAAIAQKVAALAGRSETQTRDVFDLDLLFRRHSDAVKPGDIPTATLTDAAARTLDLDFRAFADQVVPFLESDISELYDEAAWDQMRAYVIEKMESLR